MSEVTGNGDAGFDPENILRIYRGEPALFDGEEASEVLTPRQLEAASQFARGLKQIAIAENMDITVDTTRVHLRSAYRRLKIVSRHDLVAYFPIDQGDKLLRGKEFADFEPIPDQLDILEALSVGLSYKQIAEQRKVPVSSLWSRIIYIKSIWPDVRGTVRPLRVANGLRAKYIRAIEAASGEMEPEGIQQFTLPRLMRLEPAILDSYIEPK